MAKKKLKKVLKNDNKKKKSRKKKKVKRKREIKKKNEKDQGLPHLLLSLPFLRLLQKNQS